MRRKKKRRGPDPQAIGHQDQRSARLAAAPRLHHEPRAATEACGGGGEGGRTGTSRGPQKRPLHQTPRARGTRETWRELGGPRSPLWTEEDTTSPQAATGSQRQRPALGLPARLQLHPGKGPARERVPGGRARCREAPGSPRGGPHSRRPSRGPGTWDARAAPRARGQESKKVASASGSPDPRTPRPGPGSPRPPSPPPAAAGSPGADTQPHVPPRSRPRRPSRAAQRAAGTPLPFFSSSAGRAGNCTARSTRSAAPAVREGRIAAGSPQRVREGSGGVRSGGGGGGARAPGWPVVRRGGGGRGLLGTRRGRGPPWPGVRTERGAEAAAPAPRRGCPDV